MAVFIWSRVTLVMSALIRNVHLMSDGWWGTSITDNSPSLVILVAVIYTRIMFCLHEIVQVSAWYRPHYICLGSLWQVDMTTAASCSVWLQCCRGGCSTAHQPLASAAWPHRQYSEITRLHCLQLRSVSFCQTTFPSPTVAYFHTLWTNQTETAQLELWHFLAFRSGSRISKRREGREGLITGSAKLNTRLNGFHVLVKIVSTAWNTADSRVLQKVCRLI